MLREHVQSTANAHTTGGRDWHLPPRRWPPGRAGSVSWHPGHTSISHDLQHTLAPFRRPPRLRPLRRDAMCTRLSSHNP